MAPTGLVGAPSRLSVEANEGAVRLMGGGVPRRHGRPSECRRSDAYGEPPGRVRPAAPSLATSTTESHVNRDLVTRARFVKAFRAQGPGRRDTHLSLGPGVAAGTAHVSASVRHSRSRDRLPECRHHRHAPRLRSLVAARDASAVDEPPDLDSLLDEVASGQHRCGLAARCRPAAPRNRVFLRRGEWEGLATGLVDELGRSVGISYVRRFEAAVLLLRHPSSSGPMSRALGSHVLDPDAQVVAPVLNLLSEVDEQPASDLVLRLLQSERLPLRRAAASVAADKLRRGHFAASSLTVLEEHARHRLRHEDPLEGGLDALDLATQLPAPPSAGCSAPSATVGCAPRWSAPRRPAS